MEDAHIAEPHLDVHGNQIISLYAVFDGHGGPEVAQFAKAKMPNIIKNNTSFKQGDYKKTLCEAFHAIDELLEQPEHQLAIGMTPNETSYSNHNNNRTRDDSGAPRSTASTRTGYRSQACYAADDGDAARSSGGACHCGRRRPRRQKSLHT